LYSNEHYLSAFSVAACREWSKKHYPAFTALCYAERDDATASCLSVCLRPHSCT